MQIHQPKTCRDCTRRVTAETRPSSLGVPRTELSRDLRLVRFEHVLIAFEALVLELKVLDRDLVRVRVKVRYGVVFRHPRAIVSRPASS
jgi:hypothetical protein